MLGMALPLIYLPGPLCVCAHVCENVCVCVCSCVQMYAEARVYTEQLSQSLACHLSF